LPPGSGLLLRSIMVLTLLVLLPAAADRAFIAEGQRGLFGTGTRTSMYDMQAMDQTCWCDIYCQELKDFSDDYDELCAAAPTDSPVPTLSPSKNPTTESPANSCNQYCGNSMPPDGTCYYDSECTSGAIAALMLMITVHLNRRAALG
jgi:hypothetical protein